MVDVRIFVLYGHIPEKNSLYCSLKTGCAVGYFPIEVDINGE